MTEPDDLAEHDYDPEAMWAHNQWPAVGLFTGLGIGLALSVLFAVGWWAGAGYTLGLGVGGLLVGYLGAVLVARVGSRRR
ncbi:MAG: hypothetical protein HRU76_03875 [Phycisphaeraceae bacterium]|nr:hypothetical protein [Phycisphaerales bacterium]QOJ16774.1 MAG: hypothetical protein HRU76_03875 [Phycisphaeraceae bacterium]